MGSETNRDVITLGDKTNKRQAAVSIPAQAAANKPGILSLQAVATTGTVTPYYVWVDNGTMRIHTSIPTTAASDGSAVGSGASGASTALSNLASVAINTTLVSDTDDTDDLGSSSKQWKDLYIDGIAYVDSAFLDIAELGGATNYLKVAAGGVTTLEGSATFDGIATGNFVDKSATEAITGAWTFSNASGILTDTITERSAGAGVTIDSLQIKDEEVYLATDNKRIMFGDDAATDSYIKFDGTNLTFYDSALATTATLSSLAGKTPTWSGDATLTNGKFTWADTDNEVAGPWTFSGTTFDAIQITAGQTTADVVQITANSLTAGSAFKAILAEGTLTSGNYFEANDGTNTTFEVGKYGAVTIRGNAATDVFTITAGHAVVTSGNLTLTSGNLVLSSGSISMTQNSDVITVTHDGTDATFTTSDGVFLFKTAEGTNTATYMEIKPKGTSEVSSLSFYDTDSMELSIATTGAGAASIIGTTALTLTGSTGSGGNLIINSTSHGTKGTVTVNGDITMTNNSDSLKFSLDGTDAFIKTTDGNIILQTDEGTNTATYVEIKPKGTSEISGLNLYDTNTKELAVYTAANRAYIESTNALGISPDASPADVYFFEAAGNATTPAISIYGYITEKAAGAGVLAATLAMEDTNNEFVVTIPNDTGAEGATFALSETNQRFRIRQNSDIFSINLDATDTYLYTSDGNFIFKTDEGTNTATVVEIKPKGTSEVSTLNLYDTNTLELSLYTAANRCYIDSTNVLGINADATPANVYFFETAGSGYNPLVSVYGYITEKNGGAGVLAGTFQMEDTNNEFVIAAANDTGHEGVTVKIAEANQLFRFRDNGGNVSVTMAPAGVIDLAGQTITTVNASGTADLTTWCDQIGTGDADDCKFALQIKVAGTVYYVPAFTTV